MAGDNKERGRAVLGLLVKAGGRVEARRHVSRRGFAGRFGRVQDEHALVEVEEIIRDGPATGRRLKMDGNMLSEW